MQTKIYDELNRKHGAMREFINVVLSESPETSSEELKAMFLEGLKQIPDPAPVGWEGTGFTEEAFKTFWGLAWQQAHQRN